MVLLQAETSVIHRSFQGFSLLALLDTGLRGSYLAHQIAMPTYEYACSACGNTWEEMQKITEPALEVCPACHKATAKRQISGGNFILKGGGWYADLYSSSSKSKGSSDDGGGSGGTKSSSSDTKTEAKAESKTEAKSEGKSETKKDSGSGGGTSGGSSGGGPSGGSSSASTAPAK
jgi:putative FmdB family regulatory protein